MAEPNNSLGLPDGAILQRPSSLRELLGDGRPPIREVALEGAGWGGLQGKRLALKSLSAGAMAECVGKAVAWCLALGLAREDLFSSVGEPTLELATKVEILARSLVDPADAGKSMVDGPNDVREVLTAEQVEYLFGQFSELQAASSPFHLLQEQEIESVADEMGKGFRSTSSLRSYDASTLRRITTALVGTVRRLRSENSSATKSPGGSTGDSTPET